MARVSIFLIVAALLTAMMGCEPALGPDPTVYGPEIRDWHDLHAIRGDLGGSYVLMNDLDSASPGYVELASSTANQGKGWQPIGTSDDRFTGGFDGQGYEIRDMFIARPDESFVGLFGAVGEGGIIHNVGVVEVAVTGEWAVGGVVGGSWGHVVKAYCSGSVSGDDYVGGLIGGNAGSVSDAYSVAVVSGRWDVGGLVGGNDPLGSVSGSYSDGSVTGEWAVGGLVGGNLGGTVSTSYSAGGVTGYDYVGGLVGDNQGTVRNTYAAGTVTGEWYVGGLVGWNDSTGSVSNSYAVGVVAGQSFVGGLVGSNPGTVGNSFWDMDACGLEESDGSMGSTTTEMQDIATFTNTTTEGLDSPWDMVAVAPDQTDGTSIWNIVDGQTYPFLSWGSI